VTTEVGAFTRSRYVDKGSTRIVSLFIRLSFGPRFGSLRYVTPACGDVSIKI
jgi:hypothetical protein